MPLPLLAATLSAALAVGDDRLAAELRWEVVNDGVMGGVSSGRLRSSEAGGVVFEGDLSLDNNGGFASFRSAPADLGLSGAAGLRVAVQGDGRTWQFTLRRADVRMRAGSYRAEIPTTAGEVVTLDLAWSDFTATSFGRPVPDAPPIEQGLDQVVSMGLLLADGQPGAFTVALRSVRPIGGAPAADRSDAPASDPAARDRATASFAAAIRRGVPAFNAGDPARCAAHYQTAIESALMLAPGAFSQRERGALRAALDQAARSEPTDAAWTLRRAIDATMAP